MSDIHVLSGAYAVDALDDDIERAGFERHLAGCSTCRAEVDSLREAAAAMSDDTAVVPPPELRASVLAGISKVRPLPPVASHGGLVHRRKWFPAVVAAVVLALVGVGGVVWHPWRQDASTVVSVTDQVLGDPAAQRVVKALPNGGKATVVRSVRLHRAVVITEGLPPAPDGKVYQLWLRDPTQKLSSAGLMPAGADTMVLTGDADAAIGAGITIENAGGADHPGGNVVALFNFPRAA